MFNHSILRRIYLVLSLLLCVGCAKLRDPATQQVFVSAREMQGNNAAAQGLAYLSQGRYADAELKLLEALNLFPDARNLRINLASAMAARGATAEAWALFEELLSAEPESLQLRAIYAEALYRSGEFDRARKLYESVARDAQQDPELSPQEYAASRSLAALEFAVGNSMAARCASERAFALQGDNENALRHSELLIALGLPNSARIIIDSINSAGRNPSALVQSALLAIEADDYVAAQKSSAAAWMADSIPPDVQYRLQLIEELIFAYSPSALPAESDERIADMRDEFRDQFVLDGRLETVQGLYYPPHFLRLALDRQAALRALSEHTILSIF